MSSNTPYCSDNKYAKFHYSITCHTDDLAVVHCLRGLSHFAEGHSYPHISHGGTGCIEWKRDDHQVTFRFTSEAYRDKFFWEADRLLNRPLKRWSDVGRCDNDPATPQRSRKSKGTVS